MSQQKAQAAHEEPKKAVARKDMSRAAWTWHEMKRNWAAYVMVAPFMIVFTLFTVVPVLISIIVSFTDFNILQMPHFVFFDNYIRLFLDDDIFLLACKNTFIFAVIVGPASYLMSLLVAWFINELPPKIRAIVTLVFYAPSISGQVYLIWGTLFSGDSYGWANAVLLDLGITTEAIQFFENKKYIMPLCIVVALWTSLGTSFLSFIAGLQGVDHSLYEAAAVDGIRNRWQELWYVTLPVMKPQLLFGVVMSISGAFSIHDVTVALAGYPSTDNTATTIVNLMADVGYQRFELGYASAMATVLFLMMIVARQLFNKLLDRVGK